MTEFETGFDPDEIFNEGAVMATADLQEQMSGQLTDLGFTGDEIEALFDPAPRKGKHGKHGKKCGTAKQVRAMPQIFGRVCAKGTHVRLNDPASRKMKRSSYHNAARDYKGIHHTWQPVGAHSRRTFDPASKTSRKAKDLLSKLAKHEMAIGGVAAVGTFLALYNTRAGVLKAAGAKLKDGSAVDGMLKAIQYDYEQFTTNGGWTGASTRLQAAWKHVLGFGLGGILVNQVAADYVPSKYKKITRLIGTIMTGIGAGYAGKAILDLPDSATPPATNAGIRVIMKPGAPAPAAPIMNMNTSGMTIGAR